MPGEADPVVDAIASLGAVSTILQVITATTGMRLALVARVTATEWTACAVHDVLGFGLGPGDRLDVATTLCSEVRDSHQPIVIEHASIDPTYCGHPTPKMYRFESYAAVPIFLQDGSYFGNVCALDSEPLPLKQRKAESMMHLFAQLISHQLEAEAQASRTQAALLDARQTAELREQFIAVLGHDLRNPLSAVLGAADILLGRDLPSTEHHLVSRIRSSGRRITQLVDDVLDFARGRLGGGIDLELGAIDDLEPTLRQVTDELCTAHPKRDIRVRFSGVGSLKGDRIRLSQLLSNLLANALEHGPPDEPVEVAVLGRPDAVVVSVTNQGDAIPEAVRPHLYRPYFRSEQRNASSGLGLGLYIVAEIVRSHGGSISLSSTKEEGTTFSCVIPRGTTK